MRRRALRCLVPLALLAGGAAHAQGFERQRALSDWSSASSLERLRAQSAEALRASIDQGGGPAAMARSIHGQLGDELAVIDELEIELNGRHLYQRLSRFEKATAQTQMDFGPQGVVEAAVIRPAPAPLPEHRAAAATPLRLPFAKPRGGSWFTFWGGDNALRNYHVIQREQRHAYDFLVVRGGRTFSGDAGSNASYFCWGEPILSPAAGRVVEAVDAIADNRPGQMNPAVPAGNHVVIRHRAGEYSLLAHLRHGSVRVQVGDRVEPGTVLGLCGNSGNTSEPHLHYHLQSKRVQQASRAVPFVFRDLEIDGRRTDRGSPIRGQAVAP